MAIDFERSKQLSSGRIGTWSYALFKIQEGKPVVSSYAIRKSIHTWERVSIKHSKSVYGLDQ